MKILIIGGTGAIGAPLVEILSSNKDIRIEVLSRHRHDSDSNTNVKYIAADAFDGNAMSEILRMGGGMMLL